MQVYEESAESRVPSIQVGQQVPDFEIESYEPRSGTFGSVRLSRLREEGRWTILFFYPADFTFV